MLNINLTRVSIAIITISILVCTSLQTVHSQEQEPASSAIADALVASEKWAEAIVAYESLLQADDKNANNWFNLGRARQHQNDNIGAADAYNKAINTGYQPIVRAQLYLARVHMLLKQKEDALLELEKVAESGGANFRTLQAMEEFAPLAKDPRYIAILAALTPCSEKEYRQFDFWLGRWDVTSAGAANPSARNEISREHDSCVLLEQYVAGTFTGMSLNFYDSRTEKWHQSWISNTGGALYIEGGLNDKGQMVLSNAGLPSSAITNTINKITWTPNKNGTVRQYWETSSDKGQTWTVAFDGLYTKTLKK